MEPLVPIISFWRKLPLISIDVQHRLTNMRLHVPQKYKKDFLIARAVVNSCVSRANAFIVLSFKKEKKIKKKTYIVSPIFRREIIKLKQEKKRLKDGDKILVYLTRPNKNLIKILKKLPEKFIVYGYDKEIKEGNLQFKKIGGHFLKDLAGCKAIIATAGFTLIAESLYLEKPYFAIPLKGPFEQTLNALFLKKSGLGEFSEEPTEKEILLFLKNLKKYKQKLRKHKMNPSEAIETLDKILSKKLKRE